MAWNDRYWDAISNLYWNPPYLGWSKTLKLPSRWARSESVSVPVSEIARGAHALYSRTPMSDESLRQALSSKEEILNHIFSITFAIAGDGIIRKLLLNPAGIEDDGPFRSFGKEIDSENAVAKIYQSSQPDALFVSPISILAVELKLATRSSVQQIAKYVALMLMIEEEIGVRNNLDLLFVVRHRDVEDHWMSMGLSGPSTDAKRLIEGASNQVIRGLLLKNADRVSDLLNRLQMRVVSWSILHDDIVALLQTLDCSDVGQQTIFRLLDGFRSQLKSHMNTDIAE